MKPASIPAEDITAVILAGGRGSRMGGIDKGLQPFNDVPLALHTLRRISPQVGKVCISANRNLAAYAALGVPVLRDDESLGEFAGPLAGFLAALAHCSTPWLLTLPCDTPLFPHDLAARLAGAISAEGCDIAIAAATEGDGEGRLELRPQPVFCLMRTSLRESLLGYTRDGGRKIRAWAAQQKALQVPFDSAGDGGQAFFNANTLAELHLLESGAP